MNINLMKEKITELEYVLANITEAIRLKRRYSHSYPTKIPFEVLRVIYNEEMSRIDLDLLDNKGNIVKYDLLVDKVNKHGDTTDVIYVKEGNADAFD